MSTAACPFCSLETQAGRLLEQTELAVVILSNPRLLKGHTLVLPRRHIEKPWELTAEERLEIFRLIDKYEQRLLAGMATGVDVRQNYRPFLSQSRVKVDHIHFHLLPRTLEDELYQRSMIHELEIFADLSDLERDAVLRQLALD
jgi:diadenosine tetraphosphate (Ap4A) HIT family hydrolase